MSSSLRSSPYSSRRRNQWSAELPEDRKPTDPRAQREQEEIRLLRAVAAFLIVGGGLAIGVVYGPRAVALGLTCLVLGVGTLGLLWVLLSAIERMSR